MREYVVYVVTNKENGHSYVGASIRGLAERKQSHKEASNIARPGCVKFYRAIRKYGWDAFDWKVLITCSSKEEMMKEEIRLIAEIKPEYNLTRGGEGIVGWERDQSWKDKVSKAIKGKPRPKSNRPIVCLNDGFIFQSIKFASLFYGIERRRITEVLQERTFFAGNKSFCYYKKYLNKEERDALILERNNTKQYNLEHKSDCLKKEIIEINSGNVYKSLTEAAKSFNSTVPSIWQSIKKNGALKDGSRFKYL